MRLIRGLSVSQSRPRSMDPMDGTNAFKSILFVVESLNWSTLVNRHWPNVKEGWMPDIKVYTTSWSTDCDQAKQFLDDEGIFYEEIDIEHSPSAARLVEEANGGRRIVPTFEIDGTIFSMKPFDWKKLQKELERLGIEEE